MQHFGVATLCHISRSQEQRNMACNVLGPRWWWHRQWRCWCWYWWLTHLSPPHSSSIMKADPCSSTERVANAILRIHTIQCLSSSVWFLKIPELPCLLWMLSRHRCSMSPLKHFLDQKTSFSPPLSMSIKTSLNITSTKSNVPPTWTDCQCRWHHDDLCWSQLFPRWRRQQWQRWTWRSSMPKDITRITLLCL